MSNGFGSIHQLLKSSPVQQGATPNAAAHTVANTVKSTAKNPTAALDAKMASMDLQQIEKETEEFAKHHGWGYVTLAGYPFDEDSVRALTLEESQSLRAIVLSATPSALHIATINPENKTLVEKIASLYPARTVQFSLISDTSLARGIEYYSHLPQIREMKQGVEVTDALIKKYQPLAENLTTLSDSLSSAPISELIAAFIAVALESRSSDIHIEPLKDSIQIRLRIDGVLHDVARLPKALWQQVIARIKLVAKLKLNVTAQPQDGRFTITLPDDTVDVRVSLLPVGGGESVVMRLLRSSATGFTFEDLGFTGIAKEKVLKEIKRPNGMIITTGPTGSGKTTTLYALLNKLNTPGNKIITLEDPIEYHLSGINQSQIDEKSGYTFSTGLRSIVRQDPDVIMVGEMRDDETVDVGINAALTGHLVLSTLHTNSALEAIPRFESLHAKPFLLAPALHCVIGQRLVRVLCECKQLVELPPEQLSRVRALLAAIPESAHAVLPLELQFWGPTGCEKCKTMGYKGRIGIYEVLAMSLELEEAIIAQKLSSETMESIARAQGMTTIVQDGLLKALDGVTSVEEIFRVIE